MRVSGIFGYRIVGMVVLVVVVVMLLDVLCGQVLALRVDPTFVDWWCNIMFVVECKEFVFRIFWVGVDLVIGVNVLVDGRMIIGVIIFCCDSKGIFVEKVEASAVCYDGKVWILE